MDFILLTFKCNPFFKELMPFITLPGIRMKILNKLVNVCMSDGMSQSAELSSLSAKKYLGVN